LVCKEAKDINIFNAYSYNRMSSDKGKYDKYSKKVIGSDSKLDLSALMNSLYRSHELIMK
jgi:hypothetical protein